MGFSKNEEPRAHFVTQGTEHIKKDAYMSECSEPLEDCLEEPVTQHDAFTELVTSCEAVSTRHTEGYSDIHDFKFGGLRERWVLRIWGQHDTLLMMQQEDVVNIHQENLSKNVCCNQP